VRSHAARAPVKLHLDGEGKKLTIVAMDDVRLPVFVGVLFGEVIHNLHATLDNLAHELARLNVKNPARTVQFPILNSPNEWFTEDTRAMLADIGPHDRARIEAHQPFMGTNNVPPKHNVLARLKRYSNEGKHRVVTPIGGVSMGTAIDHLEAKGFRIVGSQLEGPKALRKDAVLGSFDIEITEPDPHVDMKAGFTWYPALDNGDPAEQFLKLTLVYVYNVVLEFAFTSFGGTFPLPAHPRTPSTTATPTEEPSGS
jgi:hypothetical protein